jgi:16S rRNA (adenine1518-N6/adenine1519-N6)-dimethyltransferase
MNHLTPNVPELMRTYGLHPDKRLGQNFLVDQSALKRVVEAASIEAEDTILEIGPGLGSLTCLLAAQAQRVVAIELDHHLIPVLQEVVSPFSNVEIIQGDILQVNLIEILQNPGYLVVANIPYYITSNLIRQLLETQLTPKRLALTVQSEVARRICAEPGDLSLLAISVQVFGKPSIAAQIPAGAFYPPPKVDSAVVRVDLYPHPLIDPQLLKTFFALAKAGFSQKRKTLRNALSGGMRWTPEQASSVLATAGIDPQRRAETLSLEEWSILAEQTHLLAP